MRAIFLCAAAAIALAAIPCGAERADREKEIVVGADRLLGDDVNRTSTFEGNVVVTQGTMRMTANKVTVKEDPERHKYYVAYGAPVTFAVETIYSGDNADEMRANLAGESLQELGRTALNYYASEMQSIRAQGLPQVRDDEAAVDARRTNRALDASA